MKNHPLLLLAVIAASISGCAAVNQAYSAQAASAAMAARTAQDNVVETLMFTICAVPYGTVVRKPEFQPVAIAACLPKGSTSANDLLPTQPAGK